MSTKPRLLVPYGLKTLLEGLSRAVVSTQPTNINHFAAFYFTELMQYRHENPSMDFKDLVQEFQRRQENTQIQYSPTENSKSAIPYTPVPKDKAESEKVETESEQCPAAQDSCASTASMTEAMPALLSGAVKYSFLHRDISNRLVNAQSSYGQLNLRGKAPEPAVTERKDNVKFQEQTKSRVAVPLEPERLDKVSSKTQSQPTVASDQLACPAPQGQDGQKSLPGGVPSNGRQTLDATPCLSAFFPIRTISRPHNILNTRRDVERIVSNISQPPPDRLQPSALGSAIHLAQQTIESRLSAVSPPAEEITQLKITSGPTQNQQRTEKPTSKLYQIQKSVDEPVSEVRYEPVYIPGKEASMVHLVTDTPTSRTGPTGQPPVQSGEDYGSYVQKTSSRSEAVNKHGYSNGSVQQKLVGCPGENKHANLCPFYHYGDTRRMDSSVDSRDRTKPSPSQRPKYKKFLFCSCLSNPASSNLQQVPIKSPAYAVSDEAKRVESSSPCFVFGSSECQPGHGRMPTPITRAQPNAGKQLQNLGIQHGPVYVSALSMEEVQSLRAIPSITNLAETQSVHSFVARGNTIAVETAATRCPPVMDDGHIKLSKTPDTVQ